MKKAGKRKYPYRKNISVMIFRQDGKILMIKEKGETRTTWRFPQGGIESGESQAETIKRELREEVGIQSFQILKKANYVNRYDWPTEMQERKGFRGQEQRTYHIYTEKPSEARPKEKKILKIEWIPFEKTLSRFTYPNQKTTTIQSWKEFESLVKETTDKSRIVDFLVGKKIFNEKIEIDKIGGGMNNSTYEILINKRKTDFIVRVNNIERHEKWKKTYKEYLTLIELSKNKLFNRPTYFGKIRKLSFFIIKKIKTKEKSNISSNSLISFIASFHSIKPSLKWKRSFAEKIRNHYEFARKTINDYEKYCTSKRNYLKKSEYKLLEKTFHFLHLWIKQNQNSFMSNKMRIVHSDITPGNSLHDGKKAVLVDWEFARPGDPALDVASFIVNFNLHNKLVRVINNYAKVATIKQESFPLRVRFYYRGF
jgi:8-oxo-dGTP pyrophosphatase MutT (NUDIX family)/aminoglycoside phosphotransferase (APT) family kinase protein